MFTLVRLRCRFDRVSVRVCPAAVRTLTETLSKPQPWHLPGYDDRQNYYENVQGGETCKVLEVTAAFVYKYRLASPFAFIVNAHTDE